MTCTSATKRQRGVTGTQRMNRIVSGEEFQAEKTAESQDRTGLVRLVGRVQGRGGCGQSRMRLGFYPGC